MNLALHHIQAWQKKWTYFYQNMCFMWIQHTDWCFAEKSQRSEVKFVSLIAFLRIHRMIVWGQQLWERMGIFPIFQNNIYKLNQNVRVSLEWFIKQRSTPPTPQSPFSSSSSVSPLHSSSLWRRHVHAHSYRLDKPPTARPSLSVLPPLLYI